MTVVFALEVNPSRRNDRRVLQMANLLVLPKGHTSFRTAKPDGEQHGVLRIMDLLIILTTF